VALKIPGVTIVIPNWNGKHFLKTCLDSLNNQTHTNYTTIVVDNGSTDGSVEYLREFYPHIEVVRFTENRGFSVAVNEGIRRADGEYIALLNNDTEVDSRWLEELVNALERHPETGFCASKMLNYYKRTIIDTIGDGFSRYGIAFKRGARKKDGPRYSREECVFGACAGASIYRKELFEEVGLFDEDFFAYLEDIDLSFRAQLKGYRCLYVPTAVVYHIMGGTSGGKGYSLRRMAGKVVNKLFVVIKDMPAKLLLKNYPFILFAFTVEGFILFLSLFLDPTTFKKEVGRLKLLPKMLKKRRAIQKDVDSFSVEYIDSLLKKNYPLNPFMKGH
jgi:GT2 family glycosyltransferase